MCAEIMAEVRDYDCQSNRMCKMAETSPPRTLMGTAEAACHCTGAHQSNFDLGAIDLYFAGCSALGRILISTTTTTEAGTFFSRTLQVKASIGTREFPLP